MSQILDRQPTSAGAPSFDKVALFEPGEEQQVDVGTLTAHPDRLEFRGKHLSMTFDDVRGVEYREDGRTPDVVQRTAGVRLTYGSGDQLRVVLLVKVVAGLPGRVRDANRRLADDLAAIYGSTVPLTGVERHAVESLDDAVRDSKRRQVRRYLGIGAGAFVVGLLLTVVTYANADPGDTYVVAWGPMLFGAAMMIAGLVGLAQERRAAARVIGPPAERVVQPGPPAAPVDTLSPPAPPPLTPAADAPAPPAPMPPPAAPVDTPAPSAPPPPMAPAAPPMTPAAPASSVDRTVQPPPPPPAPPAASADRMVPPAPPPPGLPPAPSTSGAKRRWAWIAAAGVAALALIVALVVVGGARGNDTLVTEGSATTEEATTEDTSGAGRTEPSVTEADSTAPSTGAAVSTGEGVLPIVGIELTDVYPRDCVATGSVGCLTSTGNRIVVLDFEPADGADPMVTMDGVTDEAFGSTIDDGSGVLAEGMVVAGTTGEPTFEVAYAYLTVDNPTSLTLEWPGNPPVTLTP